jgi:hypothetical protein
MDNIQGREIKIARENNTIVRDGKPQLPKKSIAWLTIIGALLWLLLLIVCAMGIYHAFYEQKANDRLEISGKIAQGQIDSDMDFIYLFWKFEDRNNEEIPVGKFKIEKDGTFTLKLPSKPLFLETCYSFFGKEAIIDNADALVGVVSFFAYSSKSSDFSGDLFPNREGLYGFYLYSDRDVNITGENSRGAILRLQLKKGWNSIVSTYNKEAEVMTTQEIYNDWEWDS